MNVKKIKAKTILRKHKKIESWFLTSYSMNIYRGCIHNCVYCDGRSEKYQVDDEFGNDIKVKTNAVEILRRELNPNRKRKPMKKGYIGLGGGVGDSYQPIEQKYELIRKILKIIYHFKHPVHILTKSTLIKRDIDLIKKINKRSNAIISFSFSSTDEEISKIFEPNVPKPKERFDTIKLFKKEKIPCGIYLMPVIPFITDKPNMIDKTLNTAKKAGVDFVIFSGMTLKEGRQKDYFYKYLKKYYPDLIPQYEIIYKKNKWGNPSSDYHNSINKTFNLISKKYNIPKRLPPKLYYDLLDENDKIIVILEHIDYLLKLKGQKSPYGYAAYSISKIKKPLSEKKYELRKIKGVGKVTEKIISEIIDTGTSEYYEKLLCL